jgi:hypothetical protein
MRQAVIKIGDDTATLTTGVDRFVCPTNPLLESRLGQYIQSIKSYSPDNLVRYAEAVAKQFDGQILKLDRLPLVDGNDPSIVH